MEWKGVIIYEGGPYMGVYSTMNRMFCSKKWALQKPCIKGQTFE